MIIDIGLSEELAERVARGDLVALNIVSNLVSRKLAQARAMTNQPQDKSTYRHVQDCPCTLCAVAQGKSAIVKQMAKDQGVPVINLCLTKAFLDELAETTSMVECDTREVDYLRITRLTCAH